MSLATLPSIEALVPHQPPMRWIDELVSYAGETAVCRTTVRADHAFVEHGRADAIVTIELMAQTVAASVGLEDLVKGAPPRAGYLVAIPEAQFFAETLAVGDVLELSCTRRFGDEQVASFACATHRAGARVAEAVINVFRPSLRDGKPSHE